MQEKLDKFKQLIAEVTDLGRAEALLGWDQQTYMPRAARKTAGISWKPLPVSRTRCSPQKRWGICWQTLSLTRTRSNRIRMMLA